MELQVLKVESSIIEITVLNVDAGALDPSLNMSYCYGVDPLLQRSSITGGVPDDASTSLGTLTYQWERSTNGAAGQQLHLLRMLVMILRH